MNLNELGSHLTKLSKEFTLPPELLD